MELKSIPSLGISFDGFTVVCGDNASGKSSIIWAVKFALGLLKWQRRARRHNAMAVESATQSSLGRMAHSYCSRLIEERFPTLNFSDMRPFASLGGWLLNDS